MRHPTDGTLRRLLDEPAGVADTDREHVTGCPACRSRLAAVHADAAFADAALSAELTVDVDAGWHRLSQAIAAESRTGTAPAVPGGSRRAALPGRLRAVLRRPVVAVLSAAVLLAGAGAAAAADWLQIFRAEQVAPVTAPRADLVALPELDAFGTFEIIEKVEVRKVADAAAAARATGLPVPQVDEPPRGVTGEPAYHVLGRASAVFTFSAERTARTAAAAGKTPPPPPPGLDGSEFRLTAGPGLAAVWTRGGGVPTMIVGRMVAPAAHSSGIPFETARDYLLSLPIVPENVASQLRAFSGEGTTLPLFTVAERLTSTTADVGGTPATVLAARDRTMAGVIWVKDGVVTAVAGSLSADEVLTVARGLREGR